jgi:hypothetical protein
MSAEEGPRAAGIEARLLPGWRRAGGSNGRMVAEPAA